MNKLNSKLLGTALLFAAGVVPQAANANPTCTLGVKPGLVITSTSLQSEPTAQAIGHALYIDSSYQGVRDANCSEQDVVNAIVVHNGPGPYDAVQPIRVPVVTGVTTTTTTTTTTAASQPVAPATQVVVPPAVVAPTTVVVDNTPEIRQAQARLTQMEREHAALQRALAQKPVAVRDKSEIARLNALATSIATAQRDIAALKAAVALKADKTYVDTHDTALRSSVTAAQTTATQALTAANAKSDGGLTGWKWWAYMLGLPLLALLALGIAIAARRTANTANNKSVGLSDTEVSQKIAASKVDTTKFATKDDAATKAEVAQLRSEVERITSGFAHEVKKITEGSQRTLLPAEIKALADNVQFNYYVQVDGSVVSFDCHVVQHTASGDALVKVTEMPKPVTAKALFGAVAQFIEEGGTLPNVHAASGG